MFQPFVLRETGGRLIAIIGQAFPYTPIANPQRFIPNWTFGIRASAMQALIDRIREEHPVDAVVLLSHNGMDVDIKLAGEVSGLDLILGGHTHDGMPLPVKVPNNAGSTLVANSGSNGKFLTVVDLDFGDSGIRGIRHRLLPVFSNLLPADPAMQDYIDGVREPWLGKLQQPLAMADELLYRRGNFNGTFDQIICEAQMAVGDAQIALSPGFRWGTTVLPGEMVSMERVLEQTCITYPETYVREMTGAQIRAILEDIGDNLFNPDPFYQQGGDMVRVGGMNYVCDPLAGAGERISEMTLDDGTSIDPGKNYKVAGWATVASQAPGPPIWDVVGEYLKDRGTASIERLNTPVMKNIISQKDRQFADLYFGGSDDCRGNAARCYKRIHPQCRDSTAETNGPRLLRKAQVRAYLDTKIQKQREETEINAQWVLEQSVHFYDMCMGDIPVPVTTFNTDGEPVTRYVRQFSQQGAKGALELIGKNIGVQAFQQTAEVTHIHKLEEMLSRRTKALEATVIDSPVAAAIPKADRPAIARAACKVAK